MDIHTLRHRLLFDRSRRLRRKKCWSDILLEPLGKNLLRNLYPVARNCHNSPTRLHWGWWWTVAACPPLCGECPLGQMGRDWSLDTGTEWFHLPSQLAQLCSIPSHRLDFLCTGHPALDRSQEGTEIGGFWSLGTSHGPETVGYWDNCILSVPPSSRNWQRRNKAWGWRFDCSDTCREARDMCLREICSLSGQNQDRWPSSLFQPDASAFRRHPVHSRGGVAGKKLREIAFYLDILCIFGFQSSIFQSQSNVSCTFSSRRAAQGSCLGRNQKPKFYLDQADRAIQDIWRDNHLDIQRWAALQSCYAMWLWTLPSCSLLIASKRRRSQVDFCIGSLTVCQSPESRIWILKPELLDPWLILISSNLSEQLLFFSNWQLQLLHKSRKQQENCDHHKKLAMISYFLWFSNCKPYFYQIAAFDRLVMHNHHHPLLCY